MTDWAEYLDALAKPGAWTSLLEIHAAARISTVPSCCTLTSCLFRSAIAMPRTARPLCCGTRQRIMNSLRVMCRRGLLCLQLMHQNLVARVGAAPPSDESIASGHTRISAFSEPPLPRPLNSLIRPRPPISQREGGSGADWPLPQPFNSLIRPDPGPDPPSRSGLPTASSGPDPPSRCEMGGLGEMRASFSHARVAQTCLCVH